MGNFVWGALVAVGLLMYIGAQESGSPARGEIVAIHNVRDLGVTHGEPDFGVRVRTTVRNVGAAGYLTLEALLSSSEGEWRREQRLHFDAGESRELSWFFHEPTINVSNVQSTARVSPGGPQETPPTPETGRKKEA